MAGAHRPSAPRCQCRETGTPAEVNAGCPRKAPGQGRAMPMRRLVDCGLAPEFAAACQRDAVRCRSSRLGEGIEARRIVATGAGPSRCRRRSPDAQTGHDAPASGSSAPSSRTSGRSPPSAGERKKARCRQVLRGRWRWRWTYGRSRWRAVGEPNDAYCTQCGIGRFDLHQVIRGRKEARTSRSEVLRAVASAIGAWPGPPARNRRASSAARTVPAATAASGRGRGRRKERRSRPSALPAAVRHGA